jgi:HPt (histidine-containing phosphotransfer) domain-containing protein
MTEWTMTKINKDDFVEMQAIHADTLPIILQMFIDTIGESIDELRQVIPQNDADSVYKKGHSSRGVCVGINVVFLGELFGQMELKGRNGELQGSSELIEKIQAEYDEVKLEFDSYLSSL